MKRYILIIAMFIVAFTSCKKFIDVNTNPNDPVDVPAKLLLTNTTIGTAWISGSYLGRAAAVLMQYNAGLSGDPNDIDVYQMDDKFDNAWNFEIYTTIPNLRIIINKTQAESPAYAGIAKLQMAYIFSVATDLWGDVPYSQAGFATEFPQPRFDKQEDIYQGNGDIKGLLDLVKEGVADLSKPSTTKPTTDDIVYAGNLDKWKRMGNTLLLKLAIQISTRNPTLAKSTISDVITGNTFINDNSLDYEVPFANSTSNQNPYFQYDIVYRPDEEMASLRFINMMKLLNDTVRLNKYYTKPNGVFTGYDNGNNVVAPTLANRSRYNTYVVGSLVSPATAAVPVRIITNYQRAFILAEAAVILGTAGDANALYQEGIKASMKKTGMTDAEINTYFATNPAIVTLAGTTAQKQQQIITQKYIASVGNALEAYNDFRRTGYPALTVSQFAAGDDPNSIPKRYPYISTEAQRNPNQPNPRIRTNVKVWWGL
ncbi:MAG: SusD/RagB family nutrient-binding outer membrane lipoprotein [Chitinophagaceae bacterium]